MRFQEVTGVTFAPGALEHSPDMIEASREGIVHDINLGILVTLQREAQRQGLSVSVHVSIGAEVRVGQPLLTIPGVSSVLYLDALQVVSIR